MVHFIDAESPIIYPYLFSLTLCGLDVHGKGVTIRHTDGTLKPPATCEACILLEWTNPDRAMTEASRASRRKELL